MALINTQEEQIKVNSVSVPVLFYSGASLNILTKKYYD